MTEVPQYRVLEEAFFAPDLIPVGSIIATDACPGPHLEPWNDAAKARMEAWYNEEFDEIDPKTRDKTGKKIKPHAVHRRAEYVAADQQTATVIEAPEVGDGGGKTLAELAVRKPTDQRPPPSRQFKKVSPVEDAPKPTAAVISPGPKTGTVTGGPPSSSTVTGG